MGSLNLIVICTKCGQMAPYTPPGGSDPWGKWDWHQPCPNCGAEAWAEHDVNRDWRAGKLLEEPR